MFKKFFWAFVNKLVWTFVFIFGFCVVFALVSSLLLAYELKTNRIQSYFFHKLASKFTFEIKDSANPKIEFPKHGPHNVRRGYSLIPKMTDLLKQQGFQVESQAWLSPEFTNWIGKGFNFIYDEKKQAGIKLLSSNGDLLFEKKFPNVIYPNFDSIPPIVVKTLLFIENKTLLDSNRIHANPALDWRRLGKAGVEYLQRNFLGKRVNVPGGSTLATQIEKFTHTERGFTATPNDKLVQIVSATARAYRSSDSTLEARKKIITEYINTVPLTAISGYGEINGLSEGLFIWYGMKAETVNRLLSKLNDPMSVSQAEWDSVGLCYRMVLNLFVSHRRPTFYLKQNPQVLKELVDMYLNGMVKAGVIPERARQAALNVSPVLNKMAQMASVPFGERKYAYAFRSRLSHRLELDNLYVLDRLDLTVETTLYKKAQEEVVRHFKKLESPEYVSNSHYNAFRLLDKGDPSKIVYSLVLYQKQGGKNTIRVYADNYPHPLNINEGAKLDLGSTAKLRTLVTYLEVFSDLHKKYTDKSPKDLRDTLSKQNDNLSRWVLEYLLKNPKAKLDTLLDASLNRSYSASPHVTFFTGGGEHRFKNFDPEDDGKTFTVREALQRSNNLVFIRLMRDVVNHMMYRMPGSTALLLDSMTGSRKEYLEKFSLYEGQIFLSRFYKKYHTLAPEQILPILMQSFHVTPHRLTYLHRFLFPQQQDSTHFYSFLQSQNIDSMLTEEKWAKLYQKNKSQYSLSDVGFLLRIHPLELWTVRHMLQYPKSKWADLKDSSQTSIIGVYQWLMKSKRKKSQDIRIRSILEIESFLEIHQSWKKLGYPFRSLVPSLATAIGSSADRPIALADLMGILVNGGMAYPKYGFYKMVFGEGTPFHTQLVQQSGEGLRVLDSTVAQVVLNCLSEVVSNGSGARVYNVYKDSSDVPLRVGGKTGTGDHRFETFGSSGKLSSSRVVGRSATFVFYIGTSFYGVLTASIQGDTAGSYGFTSGLPVQILKDLEPVLTPMMRELTDRKINPKKEKPKPST